MNCPCALSISKKQIVALTGLMLIGFLIVHLSGNFLLFAGPEAFNTYSAKLTSLRPALLILEFGLLALFVVHLALTASLVLDARRARGQDYQLYKGKAPVSFTAASMKYTGSVIVAFVIWHLLDFTFAEKVGAHTIVDGQSLGLYGLVWNSFLNPWHSLGYIAAVSCIGLHLTHGVQSVLQSFGLLSSSARCRARCASKAVGVLVALGFSSLPLYVLIKNAGGLCSLWCSLCSSFCGSCGV